MPQKTRDLGLNQNGKGSADRSNRKKFAARFPAALTGKVDGFERRGGRLVKVYGVRSRGEKMVLGGGLTAHDIAKIDGDFATAQSYADKQNAVFRSQGFDTAGH